MRKKSREMDIVDTDDGLKIESGSKISGVPQKKISKAGVHRGDKQENKVDTREPTVSSVSFVVSGTPTAQPRHRATARGGYVRFYLPSEHPVHEYKKAIIEGARRHKNGVIEGPVRLDILFSFLPAKSAKGVKATFKISKPDLDNLEKAVMDAITESGIWIDDAQVVEKHTAKIIGSSEGTSITIQGIDFPIKSIG